MRLLYDVEKLLVNVVKSRCEALMDFSLVPLKTICSKVGYHVMTNEALDLNWIFTYN